MVEKNEEESRRLSEIAADGTHWQVGDDRINMGIKQDAKNHFVMTVNIIPNEGGLMPWDKFKASIRSAFLIGRVKTIRERERF